MENNYRISIIDPTADERWDRFVHVHPYGWICHLSGWKKLLEKTFRHMKGRYFALVDGSRCEIRAALPVFEVRSWITGNRLVSIPFATLCDPLISTEEDLELLLAKVLQLFNQDNFRYIEIRSFFSPPMFKNNDLKVVKLYKNHYLLLDKDPDRLLTTFHRSCVRQRITRATKSGLRLKIADNESDIFEFYNLYLLTRKRKGLPSLPFVFFKNLWEEFYSQGSISFWIAKKERRSIAGIILFKFKNRVSVEYAASDETFKNLSPNHFLFWEAIKTARQEGYKIFDFGRTSSTNNTLLDFKKRWGTDVVDLPQFFYPKNPELLLGNRDNSWKVKLITKLCRFTPISFQHFVGNFCYRHWG